MEDVLAVYTRPSDPHRPQVCVDATSKQLLRDTRTSLPVEPLTGTRWVDVTEHRTKLHWAHQIQHLVDVRQPDAEQIVLVLDNLNVHTPAALQAAVPPPEAKRLADKREIHPTPKHGSWLHMAETELSALSRQCFNSRVPDAEVLITEVVAWQQDRNTRHVPVNWRFTADDARISLKRLYSSLQE